MHRRRHWKEHSYKDCNLRRVTNFSLKKYFSELSPKTWFGEEKKATFAHSSIYGLRLDGWNRLPLGEFFPNITYFGPRLIYTRPNCVGISARTNGNIYLIRNSSFERFITFALLVHFIGEFAQGYKQLNFVNGKKLLFVIAQSVYYFFDYNELYEMRAFLERENCPATTK